MLDAAKSLVDVLVRCRHVSQPTCGAQSSSCAMPGSAVPRFFASLVGQLGHEGPRPPLTKVLELVVEATEAILELVVEATEVVQALRADSFLLCDRS